MNDSFSVCTLREEEVETEALKKCFGNIQVIDNHGLSGLGRPLRHLQLEPCTSLHLQQFHSTPVQFQRECKTASFPKETSPISKQFYPGESFPSLNQVCSL